MAGAAATPAAYVDNQQCLGCHEAQGYYFARPMPEQACTAFLLRHALQTPDSSTTQLLVG